MLWRRTVDTIGAENALGQVRGKRSFLGAVVQWRIRAHEMQFASGPMRFA